jgi:hypothetical protein
MDAEHGSIRFLRDRLLGFSPEALVTLIVNSINETADTIIQANQAQLYISSMDAFGNKLSLYSSPIYALDKEKQNPLPGFLHPDLFLTGDFYRGFKVTVDANGLYSVYSIDIKADKLTAQYGCAIFGLTKENMQKYAIETFFPVFEDGFIGATGLIFQQAA